MLGPILALRRSVITIACSIGTTCSLWICLILLACPFRAFSRAPRGYTHHRYSMKTLINHMVKWEKAALAATSTHQLVGLSLQVSGEGQEVHESDSFI